MHSNKLLIGFFLVLLTIIGCKKDGVNPKPEEGTEGKDPKKEILLRDSAYYYSLALSLWSSLLPEPKIVNDKIDLKTYTNKFNNAEEVLNDLRTYAKQDRFSFVDRAGTVSEEIQQGVYKETGVTPIFLYSSQGATNASMYIKLVQKSSPAAKAGFKRGMRVVSINGDTKVDYNSESVGDKFPLANKFFSGEKLTVVVEDPTNNSQKTLTVTGEAYQIDPVLESKIIRLNKPLHGEIKIGYLAYTSFVNVFNNQGNPNSYYAALDNSFKSFEGVDELVVDLRYNGGGSTSTAEFMANNIVPYKGNSDLMYSYKVNSILAGWGWTSASDPNAPFKPVNFNKKNSLNLKRVYFLVTSSTASASELVINSLAPYMDVQIISTNNRGTYGKPVGFFETKVVHDYASFYITSFQMLNKDGFGDYFTGLSGTKKNANDGFAYELGDPNENMLSEALYHILNDKYSVAKASARKTSKTDSVILDAAELQPKDQHIKGMFKFAIENQEKQLKR